MKPNESLLFIKARRAAQFLKKLLRDQRVSNIICVSLSPLIPFSGDPSSSFPPPPLCGYISKSLRKLSSKGFFNTFGYQPINFCGTMWKCTRGSFNRKFNATMCPKGLYFPFPPPRIKLYSILTLPNIKSYISPKVLTCQKVIYIDVPCWNPAPISGDLIPIPRIGSAG